MLSKTPDSLIYSPIHRTSDRETLGAPLGTTRASTIIWYVCICILFIVSFLALVLSLLYFLNDSTKEQVIKLYGITGAGSLAIITFVIIFLDCCTDEDREDHDEEAIYRILQVKERKDRELARKRRRSRLERKAEKVNVDVTHHQRPQHSPLKTHSSARTCHHHHYPPSHHVHHIHTHSTPTYQPRYVCKACHELHAPNTYRPYKADAAVDTSDKIFDLMLKANSSLPKATHDVQTDSTLFKSVNELPATDRKESKPTPTLDRSNTPRNSSDLSREAAFSKGSRNISDLSRETTFSKGSRNLLPILKETSEQYEINDTTSEQLSITNTDVLTVSDV